MSEISKWIEKNKNEYGQKKAIIYRENPNSDNYISISYNELYNKINSFVTYLQNNNFLKKRIAIIGNNTLEWVVSFYSAFAYTGGAVLIDKELSKGDMEEILIQTNSELVIIDEKLNISLSNYKSLSFDDVSKIILEKNEDILNNRHSGEIILHTSGTTGEHKYVLLTEHNVIKCIPELNRKWQVTEKDRLLLIIPLYHIYAITSMLHGLYAGIDTVLENDYSKLNLVLKKTRPTLFMGVPLIFNKIMNSVLAKNKFVVNIMIRFSNMCLKCNIDIRKKVFKKIHDFFGGRYFFGCSAGSLLPYETNKFFNDVGLPIYNVYGMTETSGPVALNYKNNNDYNSVGKILSFEEVIIENKDEDERGEICVKGENVFDGYINEKHSPNLQNMYFNTGDIGYIENGFLYVVGRKKNILTGENGKNISPEELRKKILKNEKIDDCMIVMENNKLIALINSELDEETIKHIIDRLNNTLPKYKKISNFKIMSKNLK